MSFISALDPLPATHAPTLAPRGLPVTASDFSGSLETAQELDAAAQDRARTAANQLVATALVQPILAEVRNSPFKSDLFSGGRSEEIFGQQLDTLLAEQIAASPNLALGSVVAKQLAGAGAPAAGTAVNTLG